MVFLIVELKQTTQLYMVYLILLGHYGHHSHIGYITGSRVHNIMKTCVDCLLYDMKLIRIKLISRIDNIGISIDKVLPIPTPTCMCVCGFVCVRACTVCVWVYDTPIMILLMGFLRCCQFLQHFHSAPPENQSLQLCSPVHY